MKQFFLITNLLLLCGCASGSKVLEWPNVTFWGVCDANEAETILEIEISITDVFDKYKLTMPLKKKTEAVYGSTGGGISGDGLNGKGYGLSYRLAPTDEESMIFSFAANWTLETHRGQYKSPKTPITINKPGRHQDGHKTIVKWNFRTPQRSFSDFEVDPVATRKLSYDEVKATLEAIKPFLPTDINMIAAEDE